VRSFWGVAIAAASLLLSGCWGGRFTGDPNQPVLAPGVALQGKVHGGQQPISGADVYLYQVGTGGYGGASTSLLVSPGYVTTDANGNFSITNDYTCPANAQVYLFATGGNSGSGTNSAIGLLAGLGACSSLTSTTGIWVDEVSTIATAYALAGYAKDAKDISSSGSALALAGVENAFDTITNLETLGTGVALAMTPGGNGTAPQAEIDTLANILAACINSSSASSTNCTTLLGDALPNGTSGTAPTETATAAINIAHNPWANISALYGLQTASAPFQPMLSAAPNDFTVAISYSGGGLDEPRGLAIDAEGDIWVANYAGDSIVELSPLGVPMTGSGGITGNGVSFPSSIAIDGNGTVWVTSGDPAAVSSFTSSGSAVASITSGGLLDPDGLAIDSSNNVWVLNPGNSSLVKYSNASGTPSTVTGDPFGTSVLTTPEGIAVDIHGNAWVTNRDSGLSQIIEFSGSAPSTSSTFTGGGLGAPATIAFDPSNNAWVTDDSNESDTNGDALSEFNASGTPITNSDGYSGGGLDAPWGIAIDGNGNVLVANDFVNPLTSATNFCISEFKSTGAAITGSSGYESSSLDEPETPAIDGSGNLWVANYQSSSPGTVTEFVGIASPVVTPQAANLQSPYGSAAVNKP
jgi:sugar lactone lactonase YvrE